MTEDEIKPHMAGRYLGHAICYLNEVNCGVKLSASHQVYRQNLPQVISTAERMGLKIELMPVQEPSGGQVGFYIYRYPIALTLIKFMQSLEDGEEKNIICGLLFGYSHDRIQWFVDKKQAEKAEELRA